ncbi:sulfite exporter TauE/SafE family protein [Pseudonocardia bannensis]|uniref:Probable membrane transporter protein n=1 Tax=Pseudonocardia bannensis TaxID=630973 RepID=A0A848DQK9_9PSEU|nr:sulfite exporter TauE/SafE family protein [Pseudonocardia bannensis]NMH95117.1 sulfite exporter TauE/SafE family protein [Pseudonocardia bannensis]
MISAGLAAVVPLAVLAGLALGLLGGGGSILTVPLLVYVAGMDAQVAIATSLFVVAVTALAGLVGHVRGGTVRWRTGLLFGAAGMAGAFGGGLLGGHLPGELLLIGFALMMVATAVAMLRGRRPAAPDRAHADLPVGRVLLDGTVVGLVTGLVGAGGGFLVVPALVLLGGLPMPVAVGTSLVVIAMKSFAGFAGYLTTVPIDWGLTLAVTAAAVGGALLGGRLAAKIPQDLLRRTFGWFVLVMGGFMLLQQVPADLRWIALAVLALAVTAAGGCAAIWSRCPLRAALRP